MKNLIIILLGFFSFSAFSQSPDKLWDNQSAKHFEESLVLGNGTAGASVFGGVESDKIYLNDITLWSGGPVEPYMNPEAYKNIPAIREALANEDYQLADLLQKKIQGKFSESYARLDNRWLPRTKRGPEPHHGSRLRFQHRQQGGSRLSREKLQILQSRNQQQQSNRPRKTLVGRNI